MWNVLLVGSFFILLAAKVFGYVAWSWWWITAPIWAPTALALAALVVFGGLAYIAKRA